MWKHKEQFGFSFAESQLCTMIFKLKSSRNKNKYSLCTFIAFIDTVNYNIPDDPPAIQQLVNDLDGFTEVQRDLVLLLRLVRFDGDVQLSCRETQRC